MARPAARAACERACQWLCADCAGRVGTKRVTAAARRQQQAQNGGAAEALRQRELQATANAATTNDEDDDGDDDGGQRVAAGPPVPVCWRVPTHVPFDQCGALFRCSQVPSPSLAALKGDAMLNVIVAPDPPTVDFAGKCFAVRARHRVALRQLKEALRERQDLHTQSLTAAIVAVYGGRAAERGWRAATLQRELANVAGAFADFSLYTNSPVSFQLGREPVFRDAMKAASLASNEQQQEQPAATSDELQHMVEAAPDAGTKLALVLTWICGGRLGDVLHLIRKEVMLSSDFATSGLMQVQFARGKGARFNQPYTVSTFCPELWRALTMQMLERAGPRDWLFPGGEKVFGQLCRMAVRTVCPAYSVKSLRRGALQLLAKSGATDETLTSFSGHKSVDTLKRYLNWGKDFTQRVNNAQQIAEAMFGASHAGPQPNAASGQEPGGLPAPARA